MALVSISRSDDIFVNVAGGLEVDEPAADLGVVASIASSYRNLSNSAQTAVFGEVGLTGEVRGVLRRKPAPERLKHSDLRS